MRLFALPLVIFLAFSCSSKAKDINTASVMVPVTTEITEDNLEPVKAKIDELVKGGDKAILLQLNSPGGSIKEGWDFVSYLKNKKKNGIRIQCLVENYAASMAAVILEGACDDRWMVPQGNVLFHQGSTQADGRAGDIRTAAQRLEVLNHGMAAVVSKRLGITIKEYEAKIADGDLGWSMNADEALAAHAIDAIKDTDNLPPVAELEAPKDDIGNLLKRLMK